MKFATYFWELEVYKTAQQLTTEIFELTKSFPREETYSLTDQIRRSSRSIGAQIAEAWGRRRYEKNFVSKLTEADGEQEETVHWLLVAAGCAYAPIDRVEDLRDICGSIHRMIRSMQDRSDEFCSDF